MNLGISILFRKMEKKDPGLFSFMSPLSFEVGDIFATKFHLILCLLHFNFSFVGFNAIFVLLLFRSVSRILLLQFFCFAFYVILVLISNFILRVINFVFTRT